MFFFNILCFSENVFSVFKFLLFFISILLKSRFFSTWDAKSPCFSKGFHGLRPSSVVSVCDSRVTGEFFALAARDEAEKWGLARV